MRKGQRPSRHIRRVRTRKGRRGVIVNESVRRKGTSILELSRYGRPIKVRSGKLAGFGPERDAKSARIVQTTDAGLGVDRFDLDEKESVDVLYSGENDNVKNNFESYVEAEENVDDLMGELVSGNSEIDKKLLQSRAEKLRAERKAGEGYKLNQVVSNQIQAFLRNQDAVNRQYEKERIINQGVLDRKAQVGKEERDALRVLNNYKDSRNDALKNAIDKTKLFSAGLSSDRDARILEKQLRLVQKVIEAKQESEKRYQEAIARKYIIPPNSFKMSPIRVVPINLNIKPIKISVGLSDEDKKIIEEGEKSFNY